MGEYYSGIFVSDEALAHYGVKGQNGVFVDLEMKMDL